MQRIFVCGIGTHQLFVKSDTAADSAGPPVAIIAGTCLGVVALALSVIAVIKLKRSQQKAEQVEVSLETGTTQMAKETNPMFQPSKSQELSLNQPGVDRSERL